MRWRPMPTYTVSPTDAVTVAINPRGAVSLPVVYVTASPDHHRGKSTGTDYSPCGPGAVCASDDTVHDKRGGHHAGRLHAVGHRQRSGGLAGHLAGAGAASVPLILTAADDADTTAQTLNFLLTAPAAGAGYMLNAVNAAPVTINPSLSSPLTVEFDRAGVSIKEAAAANPDTRHDSD